MSSARDRGRDDGRSQAQFEQRTGIAGAILRGISLGIGDDYYPPSDPDAKAEYDEAYREAYQGK